MYCTVCCDGFSTYSGTAKLLYNCMLILYTDGTQVSMGHGCQATCPLSVSSTNGSVEHQAAVWQ
jgi:hypothetical protein